MAGIAGEAQEPARKCVKTRKQSRYVYENTGGVLKKQEIYLFCLGKDRSRRSLQSWR